MRAHALFSDGTSGALRVELDPSPEPKVFLLGQSGRDLLASAERGASAAYLWLRRRHLLRERFAAFFEIEPAGDRSATVLGESAGLCFALAFAATALAREHRRVRPIEFAATGVVQSGTIDADVGRVDGIATKLDAALAAVPPGGWVFFPAANDAEASVGVRDRARAKGLHLIAVTTVGEALLSLERAILGTRPRSRGRRWAVGAVAALAVGAAAAAWVRVAVRERDAALVRELRAGEFSARPPGRRAPRRGSVPATRRHRHGSTRIFACASGRASSWKARGTSSTPTRPVIRGSTGMRPSAMWASVPANSSGA